jgi:hypothetical protein
MPSTPEEKGRPDGIWPDEAMIRPPIEVLGEDGVTRPLDEDAEETPRSSATTAAGDVQWLEEPIAAEGLRDVATAAGAFTAKVSWRPCGPGDVVLGWIDPAFRDDSRVFVSVGADPRSGSAEPLAEARVIVTHLRSQDGKLLIGILVSGERPIRPQVDILVVNP